MPESLSNGRVCVIGLGYIGLPTAGLLASRGFEVLGVDIVKEVVDSVNRGETHIVEPDLQFLIQANVKSGALRATNKPENADIFLISVPTPFKENHKPDIGYVEAAFESICPVLKKGNLVVLESTSPVGTTEKMAQLIAKRRPDLVSSKSEKTLGLQIHLAYCPERVLPGSILRELIENDRVVGGICEVATNAAVGFYRKFVTGKILQTDSRTSEMTKLTENAFRDVNIAFANELSRVCEKLDIDVWNLISFANHHPRVKILRPGPGVGGHCIAVDPWFIVDSAPEVTPLLQNARAVNDSQPHHTFLKIKPYLDKLEKSGSGIAVLGLAFKPNIDDLRESPAVEVTKIIAENFSGPIWAAEPHVSKLPSELARFKNVHLSDYRTSLREAGLVIVLVMHDVFRDLYSHCPESLTVIDVVGLKSLIGAQGLPK